MMDVGRRKNLDFLTTSFWFSILTFFFSFFGIRSVIFEWNPLQSIQSWSSQLFPLIFFYFFLSLLSLLCSCFSSIFLLVGLYSHIYSLLHVFSLSVFAQFILSNANHFQTVCRMKNIEESYNEQTNLFAVNFLLRFFLVTRKKTTLQLYFH